MVEAISNIFSGSGNSSEQAALEHVEINEDILTSLPIVQLRMNKSAGSQSSIRREWEA
jgi:hypothetical protein